ncbi:MAG: 4Fe-4S dicluster domain-containing protein [Calditrichaeota bacterium]|nr:4Fe-4S dicluster domain-containing protein [Calditrichota bacterium]
MLKFFSEMSSLTFWVLVLLILFSVLIPFFWCRYLCPYGALLGALSWLSPFKIRRNEKSCIDCMKCSKVCPAGIHVHQKNTIWSDECHACLNCVHVCPVKDTLFLSERFRKLKLTGKSYALAVIIIFLAGSFLARQFGYWHNSISHEEYLYHIRHLEEPAYQHNQGEVPDYDPEIWKNNLNEAQNKKEISP